ncbi:MAG: ATP-binding protein [Anaerolineae bacterium]
MHAEMTTALFVDSPYIVLTLDRQGAIVDANPSALRLLGDQICARAWIDLLDLFSQEKGRLLLANSWRDGSASDWEVDHVKPDGELMLVSYTTFQLGTDSLLALIGQDQSEKLQLTSQLAAVNQRLEGAYLALEKTHAELKHTQAQLVQSEKMRALGQMVAGVAHEINNPAAFVSSNLAHLATVLPDLQAVFAAYQPLRMVADVATREAIAAAESAADLEFLWADLPQLVQESQDGVTRIRDIVLSLRNFSRLDESAQKDADINEGLRSTLRIVRPLCQNRIEIKEAYGDLPVIWCHPGQLNQVFLNVLINAVQAIPDSGTIWVSTALQADQVVVCLRDSGEGMDAQTLARLGEPFFTTKPVGAGTGLGLAISFGIMERHRGRLRYESQPGQGTTVFIEIPAQRRRSV